MGSWSGSAVGFSEPGGVSEGVSAAQVPPEVWQRLLWAYQGWLRRHEGLARVLLRLTRVCQRITFVLMVAALAVVPGLLAALVPAAAMLGCLMVMALLGRTRTVSWRAMSLMFSVGVPWAVVVALLTRVVAGWAGVKVSDDGAGIALAAFIEEAGKLAPLVVAAMVAPGRVRRFAAVDWVLLGFALGAGFTVAEDGARRLIPPGPLAQAMGEKLLSYSLNPWTSGEFTMSAGGWTTQILDHTDASGPTIPGHQVWTMTLAAAIALGIALWRTRRVAARLVAWAPVPAVLTLAVSDHAAYNASARSWASAAWAGQGHDGFPEWMLDLWQALGQGRSAVPVSACLLVLCLLVDARRRLRAGELGITGPEVPRPPALGALGGPSLVRAPLEAVTALAVFSFSDLLVIARAYGKRDLSRGERMVQGHTTAAWVLGVRRQAMSATTPGLEPGARWGFAVAALAMSSLVALGCLWQGITMARAIGPELFYGDDASTPSYFAGLLDALAAFWDELGPAGQILMIATAAMLLMTAGWSLALALAVTGAASWTMTHGRGLASFIHDPAAATSSYLSNVTAGQLAWDLFDFALTFIPGSVFGAGAHTIARTTARDMAASRTALRQGGKKAAKATEQAAATTEAQSVAESQAAHTKATEAARKVHQQRRYRTKTVSSEHPAESEHALSGWSEERRPSGFQKPNVSEVLRVTDEMGYPRTPHPYDQGTPGLYHASHAERQKALTAKWPHLGVSKPMCEDCNGWFRSLAQYQGRDWYVTDPNGVWRFRSDGTITASDGRIFNPNETVPSTYF